MADKHTNTALVRSREIYIQESTSTRHMQDDLSKESSEVLRDSNKEMGFLMIIVTWELDDLNCGRLVINLSCIRYLSQSTQPNPASIYGCTDTARRGPCATYLPNLVTSTLPFMGGAKKDRVSNSWLGASFAGGATFLSTTTHLPWQWTGKQWWMNGMEYMPLSLNPS